MGADSISVVAGEVIGSRLSAAVGLGIIAIGSPEIAVGASAIVVNIGNGK